MEGTVWCFIVCFGTTTATSQPRAIDSFCQSYTQVVRTPKELDQILKLDRKLRDRLQGNELDYLCRCKGWKDDPKRKMACGLTNQ